MNDSNGRSINLAFIDPGRRKAPFFLDLRHRLEPGIRCIYYSHRVIVRGFVRSAKAPLFPGPWLTRKQFDISDRDLQVAIGRKEMLKRGARSLRRARRLLYDLSRLYESERVDAILVWNGSNLIVSLAVYLARQRGIPVIFAEHGYLPGTMQIDPAGVNFNASVTAAIASGAGQLPPDPELDRVLDREIAAYKSGSPTRVLDSAVPARFKSDIPSALHRSLGLWGARKTRNLAPNVGLDNPELPPRFVLLPFQVSKDSQLILHSPLVGNDMARLLALLHAALASVDPQLRIVVKLHPRERWDIQAAYAELVRRYPEVLFVRRHAVPQLLERAVAVVTVNSSVGFEAFLYDKPVVTLGRNFYAAPGLVEVVAAPGQLAAALQRALTQPVDRVRRRAMLRYVIDRFLAFGSYDDFSEASLQAVATRIVSALARA